MGLFNKLFGAGNAAHLNVRAKYKDAKYFLGQIERCDRFIQSDAENEREYLKTHDILREAHYLAAVTIRNKKIETCYSAGQPIESIKPIFIEAVNYFSHGFSEEYQGYPLLLQMVSFGILFNISEDEFEKIVVFVNKVYNSEINEKWKPDSLIFYLLGENMRRKGDKVYEQLYEITQLPKAEAELGIKEYLEEWYGLHKEDPWYNTHLRDKGYSGYWAWEVGAVVKKMQLDDSSFKDNPYYPYDLVHWKG